MHVQRIEQRTAIDEVHDAGRRGPYSDVVSDGGTDFRVVGVYNKPELLDRKGPGKHDEAGLLQSGHRGKRENAGHPLHSSVSCWHGNEDIVDSRPAHRRAIQLAVNRDFAVPSGAGRLAAHRLA